MKGPVALFKERPPEGYTIRHYALPYEGKLKPSWESVLFQRDRRIKTVIGESLEANQARLLDWLRAQSN